MPKSKWPRIRWNRANAELANRPFKDVFAQPALNENLTEAEYREVLRRTRENLGYKAAYNPFEFFEEVGRMRDQVIAERPRE